MRRIRVILFILIIFGLFISIYLAYFNMFTVFEVSKLEKLARDGDGEACLCLAAYFENNKNEDKANEYINKGAYYGNPHAQYLSASMLLTKNSIEQMQAGFILLNKSAENNYADAQYSLGDILSPHKGNKVYINAIKALGIKYDLNKSEYWYRKSGENGHLLAMHNLAQLLTKQHNIKNDRLLNAYKWSLIAISRSDPKSVLSNDLRQLQSQILKIASESGYVLESFKKSATKMATEEMTKVPIYQVTGILDEAFISKCAEKVK